MTKPLFIARQGRRPSGLLGRLVARVMASETARENARALDLLELAAGDNLLEVGCGHGRPLFEALKRGDDIRATGVDFSPVMLRAARRRNHTYVASGQVSLLNGDSADLPFDDGTYSAALAVHVIYFWERPEQHLSELLRVLAPGGRLVLGYRPGDDPGYLAEANTQVYLGRKLSEVEHLVNVCGFTNTHSVREQVGKRLMVFTVAEKPGLW